VTRRSSESAALGAICASACGADLDGDLASVRWLVDGVLMEDGITHLTITEPHQLTLLARDERGATATAVKNVSCQ
jgi:hypothetical protein